MNLSSLLPTTMLSISAWCMGIAILLIIIFKDKSKAAAWLGVIGGVGVAGWVGAAVTNALGAAAGATARVTSALFGSSVVVLLFIGMALWLWKAAGKGGKGARGKFKPWLLLFVATAFGAAIGAIPSVYSVLDTAITTATSTVRGLFA